MRLGLAVLFAFCLAGFFLVDAVQVRGGVFVDVDRPITQWALNDAVYDVARATRPFDKGALAILWTLLAPISAAASALTLATNTGRRALWFMSGVVICASALWINLLGKASGGEFVFQGFVLAGMGATASFWSLLLERRRRTKRRLPFAGPERQPLLTDERTPEERARAARRKRISPTPAVAQETRRQAGETRAAPPRRIGPRPDQRDGAAAGRRDAILAHEPGRR